MNKENQTLRFCHALLRYGIKRCRSMANFVMSLASSPSISHPVELAASPFCHYHYSNLTKVLQHWQVNESDFKGLIREFLPPPRLLDSGIGYYALTHDVTKMLKAHSPCLKNRQFVPTSNNEIASNRALGVGYPVSALHLGAGQGGWCPPLALQRLGPQDDVNAVAVEQIVSLLRDKTLPFGQDLCLLRADTSYGKAIFLAPLYDQDHLVLIVRLRAGMKVWAKAPDADPTGGARRIFGDNHRKVILDIRRWNGLLIRTKEGASMKDKPLDVLRVQVLDTQSRQPIFDRPMFLAVSGKRKNQLNSALAQEQYRERYDVEPYYRFAKNKLLMDKLQTPIAEHLNPWLRMVQITSWLLYTARQEIGQVSCPIWQKYLPKNKAAQDQPQQPLTIAQTQRAAHLLFCTFDPAPFLPLKCKKGKGRVKGLTFPQRTRFKVVKKIKKSIRKTILQQNE